MCFTAQQKKMIKKAKAGKLVFRIMANCANCNKDFEENQMLERKRQEGGKVCLDCFKKSPEEHEMDCVICGEYFGRLSMTEINGDQWCCDKCYEEEEFGHCVMCGEFTADGWEIKGNHWCCKECYEETGCECWKCREKIVEDIENEEVDCSTHTYYLENCDDGDCCADCMEEIVEEHKEMRLKTINFPRPEEGCFYYLYLCNECDFMTGNRDPDCSNCGAKFCMMAKSVE